MKVIVSAVQRGDGTFDRSDAAVVLGLSYGDLSSEQARAMAAQRVAATAELDAWLR